MWWLATTSHAFVSTKCPSYWLLALLQQQLSKEKQALIFKAKSLTIMSKIWTSISLITYHKKKTFCLKRFRTHHLKLLNISETWFQWCPCSVCEETPGTSTLPNLSPQRRENKQNKRNKQKEKEGRGEGEEGRKKRKKRRRDGRKKYKRKRDY